MAQPRRYAVADPTPLPGGQGFVFRATSTSAGGGEAGATEVALKLIEDPEPGLDERLWGRWSAIAAAPHPRLVAPVEVFRGPGLFGGEPPPADEFDQLYSVTSWAEGATLRSAGRLDPAAVARLAADLAAALDHLHRVCGLVHRDVHPGNVVVGPDGHATLIDLGGVRPVDSDTTSTVAGVIGFIAPERTHGAGDERTDAWGLGMVVAWALVGHSIAGAAESEWRHDLARALPERSDEAAVARLIGAITAADPDDRPADVVAWADALADALEGRGGRPRRRRTLVVAGALVVVLAAAAAVWAVDGPADDDGGEADPAAGGDISALAASAPEAAGSSAAAPGEPGCEHALGRPGHGVNTADAARIVRAAAQLEELADGACATGPATLLAGMVAQPVERGHLRDVLVITDGHALRMTAVEWQSYLEIAGRGMPVSSVVMAGEPISAEGMGAGLHTRIELSRGGLIVGPRGDTQSFFVPPATRAVWEARGGADGDLGYPMTNPTQSSDGSFRQEFERGTVVVTAVDGGSLDAAEPGQIEVQLITVADVEPLEIDVLAGSLVRQANGTAWFVHPRRDRRWIPDGGVFECLGGHESVVLDGISGPLLALIPLGPPAECTS